MQKVNAYDIDAERIDIICLQLCVSEGDVIEALFSLLDDHASLDGVYPHDLLEQYIRKENNTL